MAAQTQDRHPREGKPPLDALVRQGLRHRRAPTKDKARELAQRRTGHEGRGIYRELGLPEEEIAANVWRDPAYTTCDQLEPDGDPEVILVDRREA